MKNILSIVLLFVFSSAFSQDRQMPPQRVRESFQREYPQVEPSRWHRNNDGWSADFEDRAHDNGEVTANFDIRGRHLDTHIYYDNGDVPAPIVQNLHQRYQGSDGYEVTRIDRPDHHHYYQARFRSHNKQRTIYMDDRGREQQFHDRHY